MALDPIERQRRQMEWRKNWRKQNPEKQRAKQRKYRNENLEKVREYARNWARSYYKLHPEKRPKHCKNKAARSRRYNLAAKTEAINAYGGICACCGESQIEFLSIDHVRNNGAAHRRTLKYRSGTHFYRYLKGIGFPRGDYQVLCHNCNGAKGYYGICPHQVRAKELFGLTVERPPIYRPRLKKTA